uniref:Uncharacterized protein n=1 Tax=viral metagenome TaxID=1070528 RepID=A0A6C0KZ21_9ZZZZ|tara:strand:- start:8746 stop:10383 length:1638 start_codon:yes stop_codon:yes gene_type:complete
MEYFLETIHFPLLKNHIIKDPILDWFAIQEALGNPNYTSDERSYYKKYILKESNEYKNKVLETIIKLSGLKVPMNSNPQETKEKIQKNYPLIVRGELFHEEFNMVVRCDLILRYDYFKKIFPKMNNIPFHLLSKRKEYVLIHLSYSSLKFKIDLKEIMNDGLLFYKKCMLYSFMEAMEEICGYRAPLFLLGKEYYYKRTLLPKMEFIGYVPPSDILKEKIRSAYKWIIHLRKNYKKMDVRPKPTHKELYPNMNHTESDWENEKYKLASEIKEITSVWNISYNDRCYLFDKGIQCWDDIRLLNNLKESKKKQIQERMIHMNKNADILIYPRKNISSSFYKVLNVKNAIFFDVESFLSFDEKCNLLNDPFDKREPVLGILGFIQNDKYWNYTINNFTMNDERKIVERFVHHLHTLSKTPIHIFHWGHAENNYIEYIKKTYPEIVFPEYQLINVLDYFRTEPIIVQGVFQFGLKSIGDALYRNNLIKTTWGINDNGLDTMIEFKDICLHKNPKIPLKRYSQIKEIIEYNRIDCQVLFEIVELMKKTYL